MEEQDKSYRQIVGAVLEGMGVDMVSTQLIADNLDGDAAYHMVLSMVGNLSASLARLGYDKFELESEISEMRGEFEETRQALTDRIALLNMGAEERERLIVENQDLREQISKQQETISALENEIRSLTLSQNIIASDKKDATKDVQYITRFFADFFAMIMSEQNGYGLIRKLMNSKSHPAAFNSFVNSIQDEDRVGAVRMLVSIFGLTGEAASTVVDVLIQNESTKNVKLMGRKRGSTIAKKGE